MSSASAGLRKPANMLARDAASVKGGGGISSPDLKMLAFRKLKPLCVALMSMAANPPTATSHHASLLASLLTASTSLPPEAFTPSMVNYVLFPLTQILRSSPPGNLPEPFLEAAFRLLSFLVDKWKKSEGGMDIMAWEQLWRFTVASITQQHGARAANGSRKGKGKERQIDQEVHLEAVRFLDLLLSPAVDSDGDIIFPSTAMRDGFTSAKSPLMSTLFQTLTYLLSQISPNPPNRPLQLAALRLLRPLIGYLKGQHPVLASLLPGTVSGVSKLVASEGKGMKGNAAAEAGSVLKEVLRLALGDEDLRSLGVLRGTVGDLSELTSVYDDSLKEEERDDYRNPGTKRAASPSPSAASTSTTRLDPFPPLTASYLSFTSAQLSAAIPPVLSAFIGHPSHQAHLAAVSLSAAILNNCQESLSLLIPDCLGALLVLSQVDFDPVRHSTIRELRSILARNPLPSTILDILSGSMNALPRLLISGQDDRVSNEAQLIMAISEIIQNVNRGALTGGNAIADLLGPEGKVERWSFALLDCLEFGQPAGWSTANTASRAAMLGWNGTFGLNLLSGGAGTDETPDDLTERPFPVMPFRYTESTRTALLIGKMCVALGTAGGETALHSVEYLLLFAKNQQHTNPSRAVSALWLAEKLFEGIVSAQLNGAEGRVSKKTRKMAKEAVRIVIALSSGEEENESEDEGVAQSGDSDAVISVEKGKGINAITTLLDRPVPTNGYMAADTRRLRAEAQRTLLACRSLSLLALSARTLSSSFRPLLLNSLYTVLSYLASPHTVVRDHAEIALSQIAYHTGYATAQNLILDNVDYVINVVSQRLTPARLSVQAPLVLIAMIRLVGSEIVPLVHDVVDEIFDALDDYHGYETLASVLLAVLVTLIQTMAADTVAEGLSTERRAKLDELRRISKPPDPVADFDEFEGWYQNREKERKTEVNEILEKAPQRPWTKTNGDAGEPDEEDQKMDDAEIPLTRSQEVCKQILEKSINFLSHSNPFLRARILALLASAIPVLATGNRESDLLPLIDRAWGIIMTRLSDSEPYVVTEAAEVIASLAEHTGDFMSRRILDHAWPQFEKLLKAQETKDQHSALSRRPAGSADRARKAGAESAFTTSFRLHAAVLRTMKWVADEVPVDDSVLWSMMVRFRPFLDKRTSSELQSLALDLYTMLAKRDADALWTVLRHTIGGDVDTHMWSYLSEPGLDVETNVRLLLG